MLLGVSNTPAVMKMIVDRRQPPTIGLPATRQWLKSHPKQEGRQENRRKDPQLATA
jgi:hypothetical protein